MGNTLCHICDIEVPTPFLNEHHESFKHKINVRIINTALDRIKRSIDNSTTDSKKSSQLHFCPVCVTVVNNEEKESHQKSMSHKNSVVVEKFLYDFYLIYANEHNAEVFEEDRQTNLKKREDVDEPKINESVDKKLTNNNYLYANKVNGNIVKSVDKVTEVKKDKKVKIKKSICDIKDDKSESDLTTKENKNSIKVNPTLDSDIGLITKKKKGKLDNVDIERREVAMSYGDFDDLPDAEDKACDVNSKNDLSEHFEYIRNIHHLQETLFHLNCKVCNINITDIKQKKTHLESVSHDQNYLKFLAENRLMLTSDTGAVECIACAERLDRRDEVDHCIKIKHITNLEIWSKLNG